MTENPFVFCGYKVSHVIGQNTHSRNIFSVHGILSLSVRKWSFVNYFDLCIQVQIQQFFSSLNAEGASLAPSAFNIHSFIHSAWHLLFDLWTEEYAVCSQCFKFWLQGSKQLYLLTVRARLWPVILRVFVFFCYQDINEMTQSIYIPRGVNTEALSRSASWDYQPEGFKVRYL